MDPTRFDRLVRSLAQPASRRRTLGVLVGGALAIVGDAAPGVAKRHHRTPKPHAKPTCGKAGAPCAIPSDCCSSLDCIDTVCRKPAAGCPSGQVKCGGSCCPAVANGAPTCAKGQCGVVCNGGFHVCAGQCVSNQDVATCGASCSPCPSSRCSPATCDGATCGRAPIAGCCTAD